MNERARRLDLRRREMRLEIGLSDLTYQDYKRQSETRIKTLDEIIETGDSQEFGESLRVLDSLLAIPLRRKKASDRDRIIEVLEGLKKALGVDSVETVYNSWKNHQIEKPIK